MAGDWIKMRTDLPEDPTVFRLSELLDIGELQVVGCLFCFWAWADKHAVDGRVDGASSRLVDKVSRQEGFANALVAVGWLEIDAAGLQIPKFDRHNGESAKERGLKNARQAKWRAGKVATVDGHVDGEASTQTSTEASTREEKRREEIEEPTVLVDGKPPTTAEPHRIDCPYQQLLEAWGEEATSLAMPKPVAEWSTGRKTAVRLRWQEKMKLGKYRDEATGVDYWRRLFAFVQESDFLTGRVPPRAGHKPFTADIDWVFNPTNLQKIIEGKYANQEAA